MIYFALNERNGLIKIGHTTNKPIVRVLALQSASGDPIALVHEMEGDERVEAVLHNFFSSYREVGEWFRFVDQIKEFIGPLNWGAKHIPKRSLHITLPQPEYESLHLKAVSEGLSTNAMAKRLISAGMEPKE